MAGDEVSWIELLFEVGFCVSFLWLLVIAWGMARDYDAKNSKRNRWM